MSDTPSAPPAGAPASATPQPPLRRRWVDWLLILVGVGLVAVYVAKEARYKKFRATQGRREMLPELADADHIPLAPGAARGYNLLLITLDTTRADILGCYGDSRIKTPTLDDLARHGVAFERAYSSSPTTLPAHGTILTGLYPQRHGARANGTFTLPPNTMTLANVLKNAGYRTAAFVSAYVLDSRFGLDQGFDEYDDDLSKGVKHADRMFRERPAEFTNKPVMAWLDTVGKDKFFAWVHYFDDHAPYMPPEPYRTEYANFPYAGEVAYLDSQLALLIKKLEEKGLRDNTLIVVVGDHGEALNEHGEPSHGLLIYDSTLRVPLIFSSPSLFPSGHAVRHDVTSADILPTVLDLIDVASPAGTALDGVSLLRESREWPKDCYAESISPLVLHGWSALFTVRRNGLKYIHAPKPELYDTTKDHRELNNLIADPAYKTQVAELKASLEKFLGDDDYGRGAVASMSQMDPATARTMNQMGYVKTVQGVNIEQASTIDPKDMMEYWSKVEGAADQIGRGEVKEAIEVLKQALETVPHDTYAMRNLAVAYTRLGDGANAEAAYLKVLELEKKDAGVYNGLAEACLLKRDIDAAERWVEESLRLDPNYGMNYVALGHVAFARGQIDRATEALRKAIELDPGTSGPYAYNELGVMYLRLGERERARQAFNETLKIDELNGIARAGLAGIMTDEGKFDEAEKLFDEAIKFEPAQPLALAARAALYDKKGEYDKGRMAAQKALGLISNFTPALNNLALIEKHSGNLDRAIELLAQIVERYPADIVARVNLAQCYYAQQNPDKAAAQYEDVLKVNPRVPIALANLAMYNRERGQADKAFDLLRRAVEADPAYAFGHAQYAAMLLQRGQPREALEHFRKSLELDPNQQTKGEIATQIEQLEKALPPDVLAPAPQPGHTNTSGP